MPTYHDLLQEMSTWGPYMGDVIGKCQRQIKAFSGTGPSRIDKYLRESATYAAAQCRRDLKSLFRASHAGPGFLRWQEGRNNGKAAEFPIEVDEGSGVVRQLDQDVYGLLSDVLPCLHRKTTKGEFVLWKASAKEVQQTWLRPTREEIDIHDPSKSKFGTAVFRGQRVGQPAWRNRVAKLWNFQCAVTGCRNERLLDGAHVKPHRLCSTEEGLDEQNGIYLATHLHKAFDKGLISFSSEGKLLISAELSESDRDCLGIPDQAALPFLPQKTKNYLQWHRRHFRFE